ncbi:MAG: PilZ domain-containing protein [Pyrinomonadaceae bacterium]
MYEHLRKHPRVGLKTELWIGQDGIFTRTDEIMRDLSIGGAFVQSRQVFSVGSIVSLRFTMPNVTNLVTCTAIVRNMEVGDGLGVQFLDLSGENLRQVEIFIENTLNSTPGSAQEIGPSD